VAVSGVDGHNPLPADTEKEARDKDLQGEALRTVVPDWIRGGVMVRDQKMGSEETLSVQHGLKRAPQGWVLMNVRSRDGAANQVFSICEISRDPAKIVLTSGLDTSVRFDIWVW
jgi:hypothetical protein